MKLPRMKSVVYPFSLALALLATAEVLAEETSEQGAGSGMSGSMQTQLPVDPGLAAMISEFNQDMKDQFGYQLSAMTLAPASAGEAGLRARSLRPDEIAFEQCGLAELPEPGSEARAEGDNEDEPDRIWTCIVIGVGW